MKKVFSAILLAVMMLTMTAQTARAWDGSGTETTPYLIKTTTDLNQLAAEVNGGTGYSGMYFQLDADIAYDPDALTIDNDGDGTVDSNFTPIGTESNPFMGTFKGNGKKITGINVNAATLNNAGLFGVIEGATLDGVVIEDATITAGSYCGGLVGYVKGDNDNVTISDCVSAAEVIAGEYTGGFIGRLGGHNVVISGCRADGYVSGKGNVGGFVGVIGGSGTVTVTGCVARGDVRCTGKVYGGFIGWANNAYATISNCWCSGAVWGTGGDIGAFVGQAVKDTNNNTTYTTFENCSVYPYGPGPRLFCGSNMNITGGVITATDYATMTNGWPAVKKHSHGLTPISTAAELQAIADNETSLAGCYVLVDDIDLEGIDWTPIGNADTGFTGEFYGQGHRITGYTVKTTEPYAGLFGNIAGGRVNGVLVVEGNVSRLQDTNATVGVGGFAGQITSKSLVDDCSFTGKVQNDVTGKNGGFGGFVGRTDDMPAILRCYAEVEAVDNVADQPNTGGFVGDHGHGYIVDAYAIGPVTGYENCVGGFAGYVGSAAQVANAWCSGQVENQKAYLGAFVGQAHPDCLVTNSYYDNAPNPGMQAAGTVSVSSTDHAGITGVDDLSDQGSFQGFDFVATWTIDENTGHPVFRRGQQHITFDPAGGTCAMESHDYTIGYSYKDEEDLPEPVRPGCLFLGWFDDYGIQVTDESIVTFDTNRTLHAQWSAIPWSGTGAADDPYIIEYPSQLDLLAQRVNSGTGDDDAASGYSGKFFKLVADIAYTYNDDWDDDTSTENNYTPIGTESNPFKGTFRGNGYTISGIRVYDTSLDYAGLFGVANGATLEGVTIQEARITGNLYTGGLVGYGNCSYFKRCKVEAAVTGSYDGTGSDTGVGGFAGKIFKSFIQQCSSKGNVTGNGQNVGGFIGKLRGSSSIIEECCVLEATVTNNGSQQNTGGFVGAADEVPRLDDCYSIADVTSGGNHVGGFAGHLGSDIKVTRCYCMGQVSSQFSGDHDVYVGAFVGHNDKATFTDCVYYNIPVSMEAQGTSSSYAAVLTGVTGVGNMKNPDNFTSYLATGKWMLDDGTESPYLKWTDPTYVYPTEPLQISSNYSGGDGSADNPYVISCAGDLNLLALRVNSGTGDTDAATGYAGKHFVMTADIDYNDERFTAIGTYDAKPFCGTFDGQGYTIRGIRIYNTSEKDYQGLFGYIDNGGTVKNVTLADAYITGNYNGGIVGNASNSTVENCLVIGITFPCIGNAYGAIVSRNNGATLRHNYYSNCTYFYSSEMIHSPLEWGCGYNPNNPNNTSGADITENDGAVLATILSESAAVPTDLSGKTAFRRSFTGGKASTVCLPFDYTPDASEGKYYTFGGITTSGEGVSTVFTATMNEVSTATLSANTPYLFMPTVAKSIVPVLFNGTADYNVSGGLSTVNDDWTFKGTYERLTYGTAPFSGYVYGFASTDATVEGKDVKAGEFVRAMEGAGVPPMRCFLTYKDGQQYTAARGVMRSGEELPDRITVRLIGKDGETEGIGTLSMDNGQWIIDNYYDLSGRRLSGKPTKKGLYIHNGKTVVIK